MKDFIVFLNSTINDMLNNLPGGEAGYANGYVAVPKDHPYYGRDYDSIDVDVHGGLTYSCPGEALTINTTGIELIEGNISNLKDYYVFGFDTCHYGDNLMNWSKEAVIAETLKLKRQLEEAYE